MAKLEIENAETRHSSDLFAQNLKTELEKVKTKINRLMDAYLEGDLELPEFQMKKNDLMSEKKTLEEKLSDFERKGNHWLELVRNWILDANQAKNLASAENFDEIKMFLKKIGSNQKIENQSLSIFWKSPWDYLAKAHAEGRSPEAESSRSLKMWSILEKVRTHYQENPDET